MEPGNRPSLANLRKAGFVVARPIRAVGFPVAYLTSLRTPPGLGCQPADLDVDDLGEEVSLLNRFYEGYNFWSPLTGDDLRRELLAGPGSCRNYDPEDLLAVRDASGSLQAVALVYDQARVVRRVVEEIRLPGARLLAWLRPLLALSPAREAIPRIGRDFPKLFLHYFAAANREAARSLLAGIAREWQRRGQGWPEGRRPVMVVCQDESDLLGVRPGLLGEVAFLLGMGAYPSHVHVLAKTNRRFDPTRPWWLNFWT